MIRISTPRSLIPILAGVLIALVKPAPHAQRRSFDARDVRQLVTFRWAERGPFRTRPAMDSLVELYQRTPAVVRVRAYQEAESPEPFDLILMTSYRGLEGVELARKQMIGQRTRDGGTIMSAYQRLEASSQWHRDEFIEMLGDHDHRTGADPPVIVLEWVRLVPASHRAYELLLQTAVVPFERELTFLHLTETGRVILGDGWDYVRILGFETLAGYHDYIGMWRDHAQADQLALHVATRKVVIVREDEALRVR